ncbi:MAG: glycosyltransferase, partial [Bryobacteraceae bacterium]
MPSSPTISIVIPVYNEEAAIGGLLDNLDGQKDAEVIVADGGSTDRTAELVAQRALLVRSATGRAAQMNAGAAAASGQTLLFLHADVRLADGALDQIRYVMEDAAIVGG